MPVNKTSTSIIILNAIRQDVESSMHKWYLFVCGLVAFPNIHPYPEIDIDDSVELLLLILRELPLSTPDHRSFERLNLNPDPEQVFIIALEPIFVGRPLHALFRLCLDVKFEVVVLGRVVDGSAHREPRW